MRVAPFPLFPASLAVAACLLVPLACVAEPARDPPITDCRTAALAFEQSAGLPPGLLLAVGRVETGRPDPLNGQVEPWPWSINDGGEGHFFASAQEAIASVAARQAAGSRSIDVGCFQVNLQYHPDAFASLAEAFDPAANARYAAALLNRLHEQSGSWPSAIALYHSADPLEGQRYSARVMAAWSGGGQFTAMPVPVVVRTADPVTIRLSATASVVRVVLPSWATVQSVVLVDARRSSLPKVFTPDR